MAKTRPWTPAEDALLGTATDDTISKRIGRSKGAIAQRRCRLRIPAIDYCNGQDHIRWGATELAMLGRHPDAYISRITGRSVQEVAAKRKALHGSKWTRRMAECRA
jgi:hypothetical protein